MPGPETTGHDPLLDERRVDGKCPECGRAPGEGCGRPEPGCYLMGAKASAQTTVQGRPYGLDRLHPNAKGLKLYKHAAKDNLIACELVMFVGGRNAVDTTLRRAAISGTVQVEPFDGPQDYFADVYTDENTFEQTVLLDRRSYAALKNRWMRCTLERGQ